MEDNFRKVRKPPNVGPKVPRPIVVVRPNTLYFNAHFVKQEELKQYRCITLYVSEQTLKLGFRFHNDDEDRDAYTLMGGNKVQLGAVIRKYPWVHAVAKLEDTRLKEFKPRKNADGLWEIQLCPAFESSAASKEEIPADARGIYRYRRGDEVVYIGRGAIRSRASNPERAEWQFERIEYSVVPDEGNQAKWETYWLDQFRDEFARLPLYNRIGGAATE